MNKGRETKTINVFIAEDKDVIRAGLKQMVADMPDCTVAGEAADGAKAFEAVATLLPTVVIIKDDLPTLDGVSLAKRLKKRHPSIGIIIMLSQPDNFWWALSARADGYFLREVSSETLQPAVLTVAKGGAYIGPFIADYLLRGDGFKTLRIAASKRSNVSLIKSFSKREQDVVALLTEGRTNEEIAQDLAISVQTVKVHVKHILKKLNVPDRTQAVVKILKA